MGVHLRKAHDMSKEDLEKATELTDDIHEETVSDPVIQNQVKVTEHTNKTMNQRDKELKAVENNQKVAYEKAEKLAGPLTLEITSLSIAEALVTDFGYKSVEVRSQNPKKGIQNKTWILKKI
jgi:hypothetical protein